MAKLNKRRNVEQATKQIDENNIIAARAVLSPEITFSEFLVYLPNSRHTVETLSFIQEKFAPNWEEYIPYIPTTFATINFVKFAKKENIDLLQKNKEGKTLLAQLTDRIGNGISFYPKDAKEFVEDLDIKYLVAETLHPTGNKDMFETIATSTSQYLSSCVIPIDSDTINVINLYLNKINANIGVVQNTETFKNLLGKHPYFAEAIAISTLDNIQKFVDLNNDFLSPTIINQIYSNSALFQLYSNYQMNNTWEEHITQLLKEDKFSPYIEVLPSRISNLNKLPIEPEHGIKMQLFIEMIKTNKIPLEFVNYNEKGNTLFENLIMNGIVNSFNFAEDHGYSKIQPTRFREEPISPDSSDVKSCFIKQMNIVLDNVDELMRLGVAPNLCNWEKEKVKEKFKNTLSGNMSRNRMFNSRDPEIMALSYELQMPPFILERLIQVLDKRYGHTPQKKAEITPSEDEVKLIERWNGLMDKMVEMVPEKTNKNEMKMT